MAKQAKSKSVKSSAPKQPTWQAGQHLATGVPSVLVDAHGQAWVVDPQSGTCEPLTVKK